jgi:hypothetical protein
MAFRPTSLSEAGVSALLRISWRKQLMSLSLQEPARLLGLDSALSGSVGRLLERLEAAIAAFGYAAVIEDLSSAGAAGRSV